MNDSYADNPAEAPVSGFQGSPEAVAIVADYKGVETVRRLAEQLEWEGLDPAYVEHDDEVDLSWYDSNGAYNSFTIWTDEDHAHWSKHYLGKTLAEQQFDGEEPNGNF